MNRILIVAAHPDDEVLGCGGMIVKNISRGAEVHVLFLGEGSTCRYDDPNCEDAANAIKERNQWAANAMSKLGVTSFEFHNIPCGRFDQTPIIKINKIIEKTIQNFKPTTLFTHSEVDSNNDHRITFRATIMATRPCGSNVVKKVFSYEVLSSSEWGFQEPFRPNFFVSLTENELAKKWKALESYCSEMRAFPFPRSPEGVRNLAMQRGMQCGEKLAEGFYLIREYD